MSRAHCSGAPHQRGALQKKFEYRQKQAGGRSVTGGRKEEKKKGTSKKKEVSVEPLCQVGSQGNIPLPTATPPATPPGRSEPQPVSVSLKALPFYDVQAALVTPSALQARGPNRFQTASVQFQLSVEQANQIALNTDLRQSAKINHV